MFSRITMRWIVVLGGLIVLSIAWAYLQQYQRLSSPDRGFESYTGVQLPTSVTAIAHGSEMNDNLFHTTHYWMLSGSESSLRSLVSSFKLERSDEDAKRVLPDTQKMFGLTTRHADVIEGYEGSLDGGRDRWLLIFGNGQGAILVY